MPQQPAVFFDRDGTLIEHVHYLVDPKRVRLLPNAAEAINRLRSMGFLCVVVTNQSVIEKKLLDLPGLELIHAEMIRQLAAQGSRLDAVYHCPLASIGSDPTQIEFEDRKPGPGMLHRAAKELEIDLSRSWMIGDSISDVLAGHHAGCRCSLWITEDLAIHPPALNSVRWQPVRSIGDAARYIAESLTASG